MSSTHRAGRRAALMTAAILTLAAATIHLAAGLGRLSDSAPLGRAMLAAAAVQAALAVLVVAVPERRLLLGAAAVNLTLAALWAVAELVGLPVGTTLWRPEPLSLPDLPAPAFEVLAGLLLLASARRGRGTRPPRAWLTGLALVPAILLTAVLAGAGAAGAADDTWLPLDAPVQAPAGRTTTLTYCAPGGAPLAMDVSEPAAGASRPAPAVLYVHGGGWFIGDRQTAGMGANLAGQDGALFVQLRRDLLARGFVVATIDYRLAPLHPWPAQLEDARCAVRFLRTHAGALGLDPGRIGAWGSSAGGQLVAMLGTTGSRGDGLQAAVDMFGPTDLSSMSDSSAFGRFVFNVVFGRASAAERSAASPLTHVAPGDSPFLVLHGADDTLVPPRHSRELVDRLQAAGVPAQLVLVARTGHSMASPGQDPGSDAVAGMVADFFARTLAR
jgi:acetyl esterase/lipase